MNNKIKNLKTLITYFNTQKIEYAILGQTSKLAHLVEGDIDIVISKAAFKAIEKTILFFCSENNLNFIQNIQHESTAKYLILADKNDHSIICPDFCSDYVRNARLLIKEEVLLKNTKSKTVDDFEIKVLIPEFEFIYYLLKKIDKKKLSDIAFGHLKEQFKQSDKNKMDTLLNDYFSVDSTKKIKTIFKESFERIFSEKEIEKLRRELHKKKKIKLNYLIEDFFLKLKRIFKKTGLSIAIMGSDGCGKSTVIHKISKNILPAFRHVEYYHLKPIKAKNEIADTTNPQGQIPYSFARSILKLVYLIYQYNWGFLKINLKLIKSTFVIFDRYYDDILVDKLRFRYGAPLLFAKGASFFIPKPTIYIYLEASGEVIFNRKQELSVEEINRQRQVYNSLFKRKKNKYIVDASKNSDAVIWNVETIIFNYLANRQKTKS